MLRVLNEEGPQEPTHIAERACLLLPSLTRILQKLEHRGLISRRCHPRTGVARLSRSVSVAFRSFTPNQPASKAQAERIRSLLGPEKHELLLDLLNELNDLDT